MQKKEDAKTSRVPVLPLTDTVVFPFTLCTLVIDNEQTIKFVSRIAEGERLLALFPDLTKHDGSNSNMIQQATENKEIKIETIKFQDKTLSRVGVAGRIVKLLRFPDNTIRILVRGLKRVRLLNLLTQGPEMTGTIQEIPDIQDNSLECAAMAKNAQRLFQEIINVSPNFPEELKVAILNIEDYSRLVDLLADTININFFEKLGLLTAPTLNERLHLITILLNREVEVLHLGNAIQSQVSSAMTQAHREFFLREQLKAIKKELGEQEANPDMTNFKKRIADKKTLPKAALEVINKELERLASMPQSSPEYHVSYNYIDWILSIPWKEYTEDKNDIRKAKIILDKDHHGLKDVKERILELLAVLQMKQDKKSPIICFVGPPGVGKTSLGQSIARAMDRKFVRMSLGGVRDEAEIRGHRRTYVGALPGRIIQGIKKAGSSNPVFMLDEIDKIGSDFRGDPSSALLEVLDPQQNHAFNDHFLELDYDLSSVMFIATANILDTVPPALLDRMEIIRLPGYTPMEKVEIARKYLFPRQVIENGLKKEQLSLPIASINELITYYTQESGVRNLERVIGTLCRKVARKIIEKEIRTDAKTTIKAEDIKTYLGKRKFIMEEVERKPEIGLSIGMAWTSVGGTILPVESNMMPGKGVLQLTGSLGDVMKESAHTSFSYIKSNYKKLGISPDIFKKNDFHLHVPDGATPKDGPSAGITITTSLVSLLTHTKVRVKTAMTGEITLRGKVTAIGGLKEKVIAALRAGIDTVVIPKQNEKDLEDIPEEVKDKIKFIFVENADEALNFMLLKEK
ncbi:MAG TPA: endopeptidase La [Lentisphaeria bacterium]|nr:MAG: endopeptidase La [Lentisphaerae bacterium GWF2_38_69]HBM14869.1 endopeptidase La [Lentisphaeria bacterium]